MQDDTLKQEMRERLLADGMDEDSAEEIIAELAESGLFDV